MANLSLILGILSIVGLVIGFIPCLGALNWLNIPFSFIGLGVSIYALAKPEYQPKSRALAGLVMCLAAIIFGIIRLWFGGGIL